MAALVLLAACSSAPGPVQPEPPPQRSESATQPLPEAAPSATAGLVQRAEDARRMGDFSKAESLLQRAQRIDPRNAEIYLEYAALHQAQGEPVEARTMAERGLLYCMGNTCKALRSYLP